ncbi:MAG: hypothetical protein AABY44_02175 [Nitrospirota bacterium]
MKLLNGEKKGDKMGRLIYFILLFAFITTFNPLSAYGYVYLAAEDKKAEEQEADNRLKEISKRKEEMRLELEKLRKEEQQLKEDIKKEGRLMPPRKKREFDQRSKELDEKIKKFDEELERLNLEEKGLIDTLKPM